MMTPKQAAANRTARLVKEAQTPVYSTVTKPKVRQHMIAVEIDDTGKWWSTMPENEVDEFIDRYAGFLSDIDHSAKCWCQNA